MMSSSQRLRGRDALGSLILVLALLGVWWIITHLAWVSRVFLPTPEAALDSLISGMTKGNLAAFAWETVQRMLLGWLLASLVGIVLGALIGASATARAWLGPTLEFIRPLPASAVLPPAISIFGLSYTTVLSVVSFGAMWPVLLATTHGVANVHPRLAEVARALQMSRASFMFKIGLPNALPDILAGMRLSMTISLIVAVVGEMITSQPGLGQTILLAARAFRASDLFAGIALLGLIGFASNALLAWGEFRLLKWQKP